jgi:hypothetical protein
VPRAEQNDRPTAGATRGATRTGNIQPERRIENVAEAEQEGKADDNTHDHGDGLNYSIPL